MKASTTFAFGFNSYNYFNYYNYRNRKSAGTLVLLIIIASTTFAFDFNSYNYFNYSNSYPHYLFVNFPIIYFILKNIYHDYSKTNIQDGG